MAAWINPVGSLVNAGLGIWSGINQRNAQKKAGTAIANAAVTGDKLIGDANTAGQNWGWEYAGKAIDQYGNQVAAGQERIAKAGEQARSEVAQGADAANTRLDKILNQNQDVYNTAGNLYNTNQKSIGSAQGMLSPYQTAGATGATRLNDLLLNPQSALENTPGYQFQLAQGLKGVQQGAAAGGALQSGGTLKALTQFGQGLASTTYQDAIKNALAASGIGLDASQQNFAGEGMKLVNSGQYNQAGRDYMDTNVGVGGQQASNTLKTALYGGDVLRDVAGQQTNIGTEFGRHTGDLLFETGQNAADREATSAARRANIGTNAAEDIAKSITGSANATTDIFNNVGRGIDAGLDLFSSTGKKKK